MREALFLNVFHLDCVSAIFNKNCVEPARRREKSAGGSLLNDSEFEMVFLTVLCQQFMNAFH